MLIFVNCFLYVKYNIIFVFFNLKFIIMKAIAYKRKKQFTNEIESHVGIYNKEKMNKYQNVICINPVINGYVCKGINHTNAYDIKEIEISTPLDLATGKKLKV